MKVKIPVTNSIIGKLNKKGEINNGKRFNFV